MKNRPDSYYRDGEDLRFEMTTPEEERELFRQAKAGDTAARERLIKNHLLFAANFGRRKVRGKLPEDEVISACNTALMSAVDRYNPDYSNKPTARFTSFLIPYLRGAVAKLWAEKNLVSMPATRAEDGGKEASWTRFVSLMEMSMEVPSTREDMTKFEEADHRAFLAETIQTARQALTQKEQVLIAEVFDQNQSYADVARKRGVSRAAIQSSAARILIKLREEVKRIIDVKNTGT